MPSVILARAGEQLERIRAAWRTARHDHFLMEARDALLHHYAAALTRLLPSASFTMDDLISAGLLPHHRRFTTTLLDLLHEHGLAHLSDEDQRPPRPTTPTPSHDLWHHEAAHPRPDDPWHRGSAPARSTARWVLTPQSEPGELTRALLLRHPAHLAETALTTYLTRHLPALLLGEQNLTTLLTDQSPVAPPSSQNPATLPTEQDLPTPSRRQEPAALPTHHDSLEPFDTGLLQHLYDVAPVCRFTNRTARALLSQIIAAWPSNRPLRVLEVGAGTGGTTAALLPLLPAHLTHYTFTDPHPAACTAARRRFFTHDFLDYRPLTLDADPTTQGFSSGTYDLVIAANTLHTARDLPAALDRVRSLLTPGGHLLAIETHDPCLLLGLLAPFLSRAHTSPDHNWTGHTWTTRTSTTRTPTAPAWTARTSTDHTSSDHASTARASTDRMRSDHTSTDRVATDHTSSDHIWPAENDPLRPRTPLLRREQWPPLLRECGFTHIAQTGPDTTPTRDAFSVLLAARPRAHARTHPRPLPTTPPKTRQLTPSKAEDALPRGNAAAHLLTAPPENTTPKSRSTQRGHFVIQEPSHATPTHFILDVNHHHDRDHGCNLNHHHDRDCGHGHSHGHDHSHSHSRDQSQSHGHSYGRGHGHGHDDETGLDQLTTEPAWTRTDPPPPPGPGMATIEVRAATFPPPWCERRGDPRTSRTPVWPDDTRRTGDPSGSIFRSGEPSGSTLRSGEPSGSILRSGEPSGSAFRAGDPSDYASPTGDPSGWWGCAGVVTAVGEGVTGIRLGERVTGLAPGMPASHAFTSARLLTPIPAGMTDAEAATIPLAHLHAHLALTVQAKLSPDETLLLRDDATALGLAALRHALQCGARVIAAARTPPQRHLLLTLGAWRTLDVLDPRAPRRLLELTDGRGAEVVAGPVPPGWERALAGEGRYVQLGLADPSEPGLFGEVMAGLPKGQVLPLPFSAFPAARVRDALALIREGRRPGEIVLCFDSLDGSVPVCH
ncbi:methyltransferase [[Actinomadura] parvosata]|uniref:methyltransferase n=1 Tax=[Actinomadura] parvosata TaxID=1955412 RepID=UPI00406CF3D7